MTRCWIWTCLAALLLAAAGCAREEASDSKRSQAPTGTALSPEGTATSSAGRPLAVYRVQEGRSDDEAASTRLSKQVSVRPSDARSAVRDLPGGSIQGLYFETARYDLDPLRAKAALDDMNAKIRSPKRAGHVFLIAGHADERGADSYNEALSRKRAEAVQRALVSRYGVPADCLVAKGYGERHPVLRGHTEESWEANRRVELWDLSEGRAPYSSP